MHTTMLDDMVEINRFGRGHGLVYRNTPYLLKRKRHRETES